MCTVGSIILGIQFGIERGAVVNTVPAQEIKRRGIAAVDNLIADGAVHVIRNNKPAYVVLSEERYKDLIEAQDEAYMARVRASLEDVGSGHVERFDSVEELLAALDRRDQP